MEAATSRMYAFVRGRELEGTFPGAPETGVWQINDLRIRKGWGMPPETAWPYDGDASHWPPTAPAGIDAIAKRDRLFAYGRVRGLDEARQLLAAQHPFGISLVIDASWHDCPDGMISDPTAHTPEQSHTVSVYGYDDHRQRLIFANSWGTRWGDRGYGYLPYSYWDQRLLDAWYCDIQRPEKPTRAASARGRSPVDQTNISRCGVSTLLEQVLHIVEIEERTLDETVGWALVVERDEALEIEDLFVRPVFRGTGYGRTLAEEVNSLASKRRLPVRYWIPHADWHGTASPVQTALLARLGLRPDAARVRWAAGRAESPGGLAEPATMPGPRSDDET